MLGSIRLGEILQKDGCFFRGRLVQYTARGVVRFSFRIAGRPAVLAGVMIMFYRLWEIASSLVPYRRSGSCFLCDLIEFLRTAFT